MVQKSGDQKKQKISDVSKDAVQQWQAQDDFLEEALEETFPGSDPISPGHMIPLKATDLGRA